MHFSSIKIHGKSSQLFVKTQHNNENTTHEVESILVDHTPSMVGILKDSQHIIKFVKARSWHEYVKLLWNHSRVTKEVKGAGILKALGLNVPKIYEVGYGIIPSLRHEYLGYYIMENLTKSGFAEVSELIRNKSINEKIHEKIINSIYSELKNFRENNIVFSDFHLDNVFANKEGEVIWIDAGVSKYNTTLSSKKFNRKYNYSIHRYQKYLKRNNFLSPKERNMFNSLIINKK